MRSGFTLIELLTVITIIGMLGAISITTVRGAIQSAKETQTRTTVAKIDNVITGIYEKYQYRKLDVQGVDVQGVDFQGVDFRDRAYYRVIKMRDLLRCDLPCTWEEVKTNSFHNTSGTMLCTPLQEVYRTEIANAVKRTDGVTDPSEFPNINAELLYLVVTNADPEARALFSDREIADKDGNGLMEFVDGWGNPICWMRWAPGLLYSDRQPPCYKDKNYVSPEDADPFDPLSSIEDKNNYGPEYAGWFLVPYVFSAGPDGMYGLVGPEVFYKNMDNPFDFSRSIPFGFSRSNPTATAGSPLDSTFKDNIDNHTLIR